MEAWVRGVNEKDDQELGLQMPYVGQDKRGVRRRIE